MKQLFAALLAVGLPFAVHANEIEYKTVKEALDDVRSQPGATLTVQGDWNVFSNIDDDKRVLWSFTQTSHFAFPSVARREVIEENGEPFIETSLLCEASKAACDQLFLDFRDLDKSLTESMQDGVEATQ